MNYDSEADLEANLLSDFRFVKMGCWIYPIIFKNEKIYFEKPLKFENQTQMRRFLWSQSGNYIYVAIVNLNDYSKITMRGNVVVNSFENFLSCPTVSYYKNKSLKIKNVDKSKESISRMKEIFSSGVKKAS